MIVGYALTCRLRLPAVADTVEEARFQARNHGRSQINAADIHCALFDHKIPSSAAMQNALGPTADRSIGQSAEWWLGADIIQGGAKPLQGSCMTGAISLTK